MLSAFKSVENAEEVPGATAVNCGHYLMHNLAMAKWYAGEFAAYLEANADNDAIFEYPKTERLVTDGILDSLTITGIIATLSAEFDINIAYDDIVEENFNSITALAAMVERLQE